MSGFVYGSPVVHCLCLSPSPDLRPLRSLPLLLSVLHTLWSLISPQGILLSLTLSWQITPLWKKRDDEVRAEGEKTEEWQREKKIVNIGQHKHCSCLIVQNDFVVSHT